MRGDHCIKIFSVKLPVLALLFLRLGAHVHHQIQQEGMEDKGPMIHNSNNEKDSTNGVEQITLLFVEIRLMLLGCMDIGEHVPLAKNEEFGGQAQSREQHPRAYDNA